MHFFSELSWTRSRAVFSVCLGERLWIYTGGAHIEVEHTIDGVRPTAICEPALVPGEGCYDSLLAEAAAPPAYTERGIALLRSGVSSPIEYWPDQVEFDRTGPAKLMTLTV